MLQFLIILVLGGSVNISIPFRTEFKRLRRALGPLIAVTTVAALVCSCGSSETAGSGNASTTTEAAASGVPAALPPADQVLQESARTTETLRSLHVVLDVKDLPALPMQNVEGDVTNLPEGSGAAFGVATVRTEQAKDFTTFKFKVVGGKMYTTDDDVTWTEIGDAEKIYDPAILLDKDKGLANILKNVKNAKAEKRETINGISTVMVTGMIDASVVDPVIPQIGNGGGQLKITLWIADVAPPSSSSTATPGTADPSTGQGPVLVKFVVYKDQGTATCVMSKWAEPVTIP